MKNVFTLCGLAATMTFSLCSMAIADSSPLEKIQTKWAQCQYHEQDKKQQVQCFENNINHNIAELKTAPGNPELTVWLAINKGSLAGAKGGLGALSLAKESKKLLEQVIDKNPKTLDGSAYTSLGSLYYKVPGWPVGFGNDKKAEQLLKKALEINPDGIDANYFYADFLAQDGRKADAIKYLTHAQHAAPRPNRQSADEGRQKDINVLLESLK